MCLTSGGECLLTKAATTLIQRRQMYKSLALLTVACIKITCHCQYLAPGAVFRNRVLLLIACIGEE